MPKIEIAIIKELTNTDYLITIYVGYFVFNGVKITYANDKIKHISFPTETVDYQLLPVIAFGSVEDEKEFLTSILQPFENALLEYMLYEDYMKKTFES